MVPSATHAATCLPPELLAVVPELSGLCFPGGTPTGPRYPIEVQQGQIVCPGATAIIGTDGADILQGTSGPNCIFGLGGNDIIYANAGDDDVYGGSGDDTVYGGTGEDYVEGDPCSLAPNNFSSARECVVAGNDQLYGQTGDDALYGAAGSDYVDGGVQTQFSDGDITNGGSDGHLGEPQTSIDTCTNGEFTESTSDDSLVIGPIRVIGNRKIIEECERRI